MRLALTLTVLAGMLGLLGAAAARPSPVDYLIRGGRVIDGTGSPGRVADVAVSGDRIVFIGDAARAGVTARRTIDASGMIVAPGFIDPHTHSGADLASGDRARRAAANHLTQGVTSILIGNDGDGAPRVAATLKAFADAGTGVNAGSFVGFGAVRREVIGEGSRAPTGPELDRMKGLVADGMCQGGFGFSAGLYYAPQSYSTTEEVVALAREAAVRGGLYETHMRDESSDNIGLLAAVREALEIGRRADMPVHIAHIKAQGVDVHGKSGEVIALIEAERAAGRRVTADQYPWSASGTRVSNALIPRWVMDGGMEEGRKRLADPSLSAKLLPQIADNLRRRGGPESLLITSGPHAGRTLGAVARARGEEPVQTAIVIVRDQGDARVASFNMIQADINAFAVQPWVVTSSDATVGHPRRFGTFPLAWTTFVEGGLMSPERFVRRSSGQTADIFRIAGRGYLRTGYFADVIVFDPSRFRALATYEDPTRLSEGLLLALVNGVPAVDHGRVTGALAGRPMRSEPVSGSCSA
ncbi:MAG: amidohydrolase family protein [Caulobacter sp.]|nr:amidohydrolase family protein [Caulobacter sp.]